MEMFLLVAGFLLVMACLAYLLGGNGTGKWF